MSNQGNKSPAPAAPQPPVSAKPTTRVTEVKSAASAEQARRTVRAGTLPAQAVARPQNADLVEPEVFGKYRLAGLISTGGMAELFLALQAGMEGFSKVVALKRILPHMSDSQEFISMFLDEARLAARLDHPNIVRIYDLGESDGRYYTAMEYLPGEDLSRVIHLARKEEKQIDPDIAATIVHAAADGLHFAHELTDAHGNFIGLVHRDVNPSNIIVTYHGNVKLVDFGIAKASTNTGSTQVGTIKGKLSYLAPEQVRGEPADRRCDVFCLGIVLWELLAVRKLFQRDSEPATLHAVERAEVPPLARFRDDIPEALEEIILKALARDPQARYQSAGEVYDALEEYFATRPQRPSNKNIAQWLTQMFGEKRATAKLHIAKGTHLKTALSEVMKLIAKPNLTPSTTQPLSPPEDSELVIQLAAEDVAAEGERSRKQGLIAVGGFVAFALALIAGGYFVTRTPSEEPAAEMQQAAPTAVALTVESEPSGAFVFLNGEPTGRTTPAVLNGLTPNQPVRIRLEKAGFLATSDVIPIGTASIKKRVALEAVRARVAVKRLPTGAILLVDGQPRQTEGPLELIPGRHTFQVMVKGQVLESRTLEINPGEQVVTLQQK